MVSESATRLILVVNPDRIPGKVTVIGRYGANKVDQYLPAHIDAVKGTSHVVVWQCDAMVSTIKGSADESTESGSKPYHTDHSTKPSQTDPTLKTRHFADIIQEITRSMEIHREMGTILGGVHLELTGEINDDGYSVVCDTADRAKRRPSALEDRWVWRTSTCRLIIAPTVTPG